MHCSFPDLHWARLRHFANDSADVLDHDGVLHMFTTYETAKEFLREDEYALAHDLRTEDLHSFGLTKADLVPPNGKSTAEVVSQMCVPRRNVSPG